MESVIFSNGQTAWTRTLDSLYLLLFFLHRCALGRAGPHCIYKGSTYKTAQARLAGWHCDRSRLASPAEAAGGELPAGGIRGDFAANSGSPSVEVWPRRRPMHLQQTTRVDTPVACRRTVSFSYTQQNRTRDVVLSQSLLLLNPTADVGGAISEGRGSSQRCLCRMYTLDPGLGTGCAERCCAVEAVGCKLEAADDAVTSESHACNYRQFASNHGTLYALDSGRAAEPPSYPGSMLSFTVIA